MKRVLISMQLFFVSVISLVAVRAQDGNITITGVVLDSLTKQPLPYATVSLGKEQKTTTTNNKGIFSFHKAGSASFQLQVDYIGYHSFLSKTITPSGPVVTVDQIFLTLEKKPLHNITVNAIKPLIVLSPNGIMLNVSESIVSSGTNAFDILLNAPGVFADQNGSILVRGRSVTVYLDGRLSNLSGEELKTMLSSMPSSGIDKIEIITNPSAKYDAGGGIVINIRTNKNKSFGTNGSLTSFVGSGRFLRGGSGVNLNNRTRNVNVYGSYDYQHNAQYFDNSSTRYPGTAQTIIEKEYDVRYRNNHSYKTGIDIDLSKRTSLGILARGFINFRDRNVENNSTNRNPVGIDSFSTVNTHGYARFNSPSVNLYLKTQLDSVGTELTVNADYFYYQKQWADDFVTNYFTRVQPSYFPPTQLRDFSPANNSVKSLSVDYVKNIKKWRMEAGVKTAFSKTDNDITWEYYASKWETDLTKTNRFIYTENIYAGYITFSGTIKKINLSMGLRAEHTYTSGRSTTLNQENTRNFTNFFPNISAQYSKSTTSQFGLGYRKSIIRYGFDFVNPFIVYQSQYSYSQGNPALKPQINHTIDFSWSYKNRLNTTLTYLHGVGALAPIYKQIAGTNQLISSYDNLAGTDVVSLNISLTKSIKKWTTVNSLGGFNIRYNFDKTTGTTANNSVAASIYASSYNTIALPKNFTAEITLAYRSPVASGIFKTGVYFTNNMGIAKQLARGDATVRLNVSDIFNTQKTINKVAGYQNVNGEFVSKPESRFVNVSFSWRFGKKIVKASRNRRTGIEEERGRMGSN
jgi:hypothetical protein